MAVCVVERVTRRNFEYATLVGLFMSRRGGGAWFSGVWKRTDCEEVAIGPGRACGRSLCLAARDSRVLFQHELISVWTILLSTSEEDAICCLGSCEVSIAHRQEQHHPTDEPSTSFSRIDRAV